MNGWMLEELLILERVADRPSERPRPEVLAYLAGRHRPGWAHRVLGSGLVRLGMLIAGSGQDGLTSPMSRDAVAESRAT